MAGKAFIETRSTAFRRARGGEEAQQRWTNQLRIMNGLPPIEDWTPKGTVEAYINEGRWVAECPETWCMDAEFVDPDWPVFVCCGGCGKGPVTVKFPAKREDIEAALIERPAPMTRNWTKGEKVSDLEKENAAHGVKK